MGATAPGNIVPTQQQIAALQPLPQQAFGATPSVSATNAQAATYNPAMTNAAGYSASMVDPTQNLAYIQQFEAQNAAAMQPLFAQQQQQAQDQTAARGLSTSGTGQYLSNELAGQQAGVLAGMNAPIIQQGYGYTQQDIQGNQAAQNAAAQFGAANQQATNFANQNATNSAGQFNAGNQQQTGIYNATVGNQAANTNAQYYDQALRDNENTYDQWLNTLYGSGQQYSNNLMTPYFNSFGPNSGVESTMQGGNQSVMGAYGNSYDSAVQSQGAAIGGLGTGLGEFAGAGGFGGRRGSSGGS